MTFRIDNDAPVWARDLIAQLDKFKISVERKKCSVTDLPLPLPMGRADIFVVDETGGPVPAYSDGTNWRRYSDGAIVS